MTLPLIVSIYAVGVLFTTALFRLRPPKWFLGIIRDTETEMYMVRPHAGEQAVTNAIATVGRRGTVVMGLIWPLLLAVFALDAPGIAWRKHQNRNATRKATS
jgi:hypothetical protein